MTDTTQADALRALIEAVEADKGSRNGFLSVLDGDHAAYAWDAYRGSLDAAKALHEALLPGWDWEALSNTGGTEGRANVVIELKNDPNEWKRGVDADPARAWLIAILRAKLSEIEA